MSRRVDVLVFPGFQLLDAAGPVAAFEVAGVYEVRVVAANAGPVRSSSGVEWMAGGLPRRGGHTLLLAGGDGVDEAIAQGKLPSFLRRSAAAYERIASVCSGSMILAAAGLLDERTATTHWSRAVQFTREFPRVRLDADRIFVQDGPLWTSAGVTAGIDLALAMITQDAGGDVARAVARELVVYYRRPGGQSQFSALLEMQRAQSRFDALLDHVRRHLQERHSVEDLAARAFMSPRHFARAFHAETGATPAKAVERLRIEAARTALDAGASSVQRVAIDCGFGDAERMRRSFARVLGLTPSGLRRRGVEIIAGAPSATAIPRSRGR